MDRSLSGLEADVEEFMKGIAQHLDWHPYIQRLWSNVEKRFDRRNDFEEHRALVESAMIKRLGKSSELKGPARNTVYKYHPVEVYLKIRENPIFWHLRDDDISDACNSKSLTCVNSCVFHRMPMLSLFDEKINLARQHGLFCMRCQSAKEFTGSISTWEEYLICDDCIVDQKRNAKFHAAARDIQERRFADAVAERKRRLEEERERQDKAYARAKQARNDARKRRRIEREAAYQIVKELGLLQPGDSHEAREA